MRQRWGPFVDLTVAPEVLAALGGPAPVRELLATADPTVRCQRCDQDVKGGSTALSLLVQTATPNPADPAAGGVVRVSFAHAGCLPSLVVVDPTVADRHLNPATGQDIVAVRMLRWLAPRALLGWEADRRTVHEQTAGGELRDLLVAHYLQHGWSLVTDDPGTANLPRLDGWRLAAHRSDVALHAPDGQLAFEVGCPPLAGWVTAVRRERWCGLLTGTTLGLAEGDGAKLLAACRAGRVVGAAVAAAVR